MDVCVFKLPSVKAVHLTKSILSHRLQVSALRVRHAGFLAAGANKGDRVFSTDGVEEMAEKGRTPVSILILSLPPNTTSLCPKYPILCYPTTNLARYCDFVLLSTPLDASLCCHNFMLLRMLSS